MKPWDVKTAAMAASLAVTALMLVGKTAAWHVTGSAAILSDAMESVVHVLATGVAALSLWYGQQAPDRRHPYGHGKIAYFSAGFEGALIGVAALGIFYAALHELYAGPQISRIGVGLLVTAALAAVNGVLGLSLVRVGRRHHSAVLVANGLHVLTDMWTSLGVVIGVGLVWVTGWLWVDPVVAMLAGANILYTAASLLRGAFNGLLDQASPEASELLVGRLQAAVDRGEVDGFHQLRHREADNVRWIEVHVLAPGDLSLETAHGRVTRLEDDLRALFPQGQTYITTHLEPTHAHGDHPDGHEAPEDPLDAASP